jgi:soluble lytic murein transglycosylase-like protein
MKKNNISERLAFGVAKAKRKASSYRLIRVLGARGAVTIALGAALSIGGVSDALTGVHFLVEKDLDSVQVLKQRSGTEQQKVVAKLGDGFAGNTVFKLSQLLPDRYVTRELSLFDDRWLPEILTAEQNRAQSKERNAFVKEIVRINDAIRREFFSESMPYGELIFEKAAKYDVDPALVAAVIEQESRFRKNAKSPVGARGLMQLMPRTGRWMGAQNLYDPDQNVDAGVKYIKYLQKTFNGDLKRTIAAYNGGEGNVRRYGGIPPFRETQHYVKTVMRNYEKRSNQLKKFEEKQLRGGGSVPEADGTLTLR